jgi:hypothetical protein
VSCVQVVFWMMCCEGEWGCCRGVDPYIVVEWHGGTLAVIQKRTCAITYISKIVETVLC